MTLTPRQWTYLFFGTGAFGALLIVGFMAFVEKVLYAL